VGDIPSVPELEARREAANAAAMDAAVFDTRWYAAMRDYHRAEQEIDSARWRLACASWQWIQGLEMLMGARDDAYRWMVVTGVARLRWIRRSSELMDYLPPSKELAVRRD
jgi:hypothetical protein